MSFTVSFAPKAENKADTAIIGIYKDNHMSPSAVSFDDKLENGISDYLANQKKFTGKKEQTLVIPVSSTTGYNRIILIGLGSAESEDTIAFENTGGALSKAVSAAGTNTAHLFIDNNDVLAAHILNGMILGSYKFEKYKTAPKSTEDEAPETKLEALTLISNKAKEAEKRYAALSAVAQGTCLARDLVNEPPNELYPESFTEIIKKELRPLGVEVEIFDEKKMEKMGFHAHLAVGMGSARKPRVAVMRWNNGEGKPLAFVGKGVTFDTGGVNLKPSSGMEEMKLDMGGAAAVVGLMKALALRKAKINVVGIVGLAENMPAGNAYRPSDVISSLSGKTIEVSNTDAEGRLVLADALTYVQNTYSPQLIIDLATLTGAMMMALGYDYCGTFVNDNKLWEQMNKAGQATDEKLWRMPLDEAYRKDMDSDIADIKTLGSSGRAGACTAAGFLQRFIENDTPWAHMDIAGTAWIKKDRPTCPKPGTGFGVRVLDRMIADNYEKS